MTNIVGLDIGSQAAVYCLLREFPAVPRRKFKDLRSDIRKVKPNQAGFKALDGLKPDGVVMEPTGGWYSRIWWEWARSRGIPVYWIGHADLAAQRKAYGFTNKRDDEDAFCLACCWFDERFVDQHGRRRFLHYDVGTLEQLRLLFNQIEQLDKVRTATINQLRQRLQHEFPEIAKQRMEPSKKHGLSPAVAWIAGDYRHTRLEKKYNRSVACQLGIEIQPYTRQHAQQIIGIEQRAFEAENAIADICNRPDFAAYMRVFRRFGFGPRNQALLLLACYPLDKFLIEGRPWVEWEEPAEPRAGKGKRQQKARRRQKRHRSLRSFQAYLGLSFKLKQSGDSLKKSFTGSGVIRSHLYMWCVGRMRDSAPWFAVSSDIGDQLAAKVANLRAAGVQGNDLITRVLFRASSLLFRELVSELASQSETNPARNSSRPPDSRQQT